MFIDGYPIISKSYEGFTFSRGTRGNMGRLFVQKSLSFQNKSPVTSAYRQINMWSIKLPEGQDKNLKWLNLFYLSSTNAHLAFDFPQR